MLLDEAFKYSGYFVNVCYESAPCSTTCLDGGIMPVHVLQRLHKALWAFFSLPFSFSPVVCVCPHFSLIYETPCYEISICLEIGVSWHKTSSPPPQVYHLELIFWLRTQYWKQECNPIFFTVNRLSVPAVSERGQRDLCRCVFPGVFWSQNVTKFPFCIALVMRCKWPCYGQLNRNISQDKN